GPLLSPQHTHSAPLSLHMLPLRSRKPPSPSPMVGTWSGEGGSCHHVWPPLPIPFSTSKASPRVWSVDKSMGSDYRRPWVKVLPVSLLGIGLLLWCVFREESEVDDQLGRLLPSGAGTRPEGP
uniref:Uncharacterized protein n=1 Tax=Chrysemys picta bellii TaxID=8478 RepID=A0A8C3F559_CHRPI